MRDQWSERYNKKIPDLILEGHCYPFYAECRAYVRIKAKEGRNSLAVPCHDFLDIAAEKEKELYQDFQVDQ